MTKNTIIVSEVRLYREGLRMALGKDGRVQVLAAACDGREALAAAERHRPETVLLDVHIPRALETIAVLVKRHPHTKVIALGLSGAESVVACAEVGIAGYVSRDGSIEDLVQSIFDATKERLGCSRRVAAALLKRVHALASAPASAAACLTPRERQIAELLRVGLTNKEIAKKLCIEVATVKNHVHNVLDKLGAKTRGEAAAMTSIHLSGAGLVG